MVAAYSYDSSNNGVNGQGTSAGGYGKGAGEPRESWLLSKTLWWVLSPVMNFVFGNADNDG